MFGSAFTGFDKQVALSIRTDAVRSLAVAPNFLRSEVLIPDETLGAVRKPLDDGKPRARIVNPREKRIFVANA